VFYEIHGHDQKYKTCQSTTKNTVKVKIWIWYDDYNQVVETNEVKRCHLPVLGVKTTRYIVSNYKGKSKQLWE